MKNYIYPTRFENTHYTLFLSHTVTHLIIKGSLFDIPLNTKDYPQTVRILKIHVPQIFSCMCYNQDNLPFSEELRHTEVAHLLEHILLEYLCEEKLNNGADKAEFNGVTRWYKDTPSQFEISISKNSLDHRYFAKAIVKTLNVFDTLLSNTKLLDVEQPTFPGLQMISTA